MALRRARAWLAGLRWWGPAAGREAEPREAPAGSRRWGPRRLLALLGRGGPGEPGPAAGGGPLAGISRGLAFLAPPELSAESPERFQICFNFARHLFDLCVVTLLCACAPPLRLLLDILGLRGGLKVWLHGLAAFLLTSYAMYLALWLVREYLLQFACLYGLLQALVLCVSIRAAAEDGGEGSGGGPGGEDPGGGGGSGDEGAA